ncbi:protein CHUP1, chloroplastic isoform X2 [Physcomitrium patens]|uniref:Chloroplast unusual positioning 1B n=1 Tax=Physcomitrium patens TaxID=3218 RepID=A2V814_PHYPA|nr:protein CHUP1, chloroplastic-like isoform X2 [Physcomitrium patens]PNR53124.1 hypothetical protein PHYPA_009499 [Physcomitrium patens]BAF46898.1 chloroplast unusual positioning 1B [Physcomitrium patens]|eukprot:XP_024378144.1 protein CHUP1, chloroplastic-like isoform X2 [Physcomitrella patens]
MIVRLGIAVTASVAAVTFGRQRKKLEEEVGKQEYGGNSREEENEDFDVEIYDTRQKTPVEEVKRVNSSSPARIRGGSEYGEKDLLLPEFDDLLHSARLGDLSPSGNDSYGADVGITDADLETFKTVSHGNGKEEVRVEAVRNKGGSRAGSRRSPSPGRSSNYGEACSNDGDEQNMSCAASETSELFPCGSDYILSEYVDSLANDAAELHALRETVKVLKQKESRMEMELMEYYALEDQEYERQKLEGEVVLKTAQIAKLERSLEENNLELDRQKMQLKSMEEEKHTQIVNLVAQIGDMDVRSVALADVKDNQIARLKERIGALEERSMQVADEAASVTILTKDLEEAQARIRELQIEMETKFAHDERESLMLKQMLASLEAENEDLRKRDFETEKKLQSLREMEVEVLELRRTNKDLQFQKRELTVQLDAADMDIEYLQNRTDEYRLAEADADNASLRHTNEDLARQVEGLQNDRFTDVEELVYLRWVNACLRFELRSHLAPDGRFSAINLNKNLSPRSQERAKYLMLQYASPDVSARMDSDYESTESSENSNFIEEYSDITSEVGSVSGRFSKKSSLIKRLKNWRGKKDEGADHLAERSLSSRSDLSSKFTRRGRKSLPGPLEALIIRDASGVVPIAEYGTGNDEKEQSQGTGSPTSTLANLSPPSRRSSVGGSARFHPDSPSLSSNTIPIRTSAPSIAASFQLIAKSVSPEISEKYPAFKDRHKAAVEREQAIKEKAQAAREKAQAEKESLAQVSKSDTRMKWLEQNHQCVGHQQQFLDAMPPLKRAESISKPLTPVEIAKREVRKANPPPKLNPPHPSQAVPSPGGAPGGFVIPPPPPRGPGALLPPPPPPSLKGSLSRTQGNHSDDVHRAPEVVEFYHSLMKRDSKSAVSNSGGGTDPTARNNMIGEIENRSAHLLAIKADVETQGDFVMSLAVEVRAAEFTDIEDVVNFVRWLDDELSYLVDERAVLKHFDWPEGKADAMREASFEFQDLTKLLAEVSHFEDRPEIPCDKALQKLLATLEKVEESVYGLLRTRDMAIARYREFGIPIQWMLDSGIVGKIKLASVTLARLYVKRVASQLNQTLPIKETVREFLLLQGVRFAFRVHQFAGGFDPESMHAFMALRASSDGPIVSPPPGI